MSLTREIFDYIVVGGGTSGLVVAARLVEDPTITVCVVEAGEDVSGRVSIQVPGMGYENMGNPKLDWNFESEPQADAGGRSFMLHREDAGWYKQMTAEILSFRHWRQEYPGRPRNPTFGRVAWRREQSALQDHFWLPYIAETDSKYESIEVLRNPDRATEEWNLYQESKQGIFSGTTSPTFAFLPKQYFAKDWDHNQAVASLPPSPQNALQKEWLDGDTIPFLEICIFPGFLPVTGHQPEDGKSYCSFLLALTHSFARGTVHITSNDPNVPPAIDPRLLDNAPDVELLIQALKFARRLAQTGDLDAAITREILPGSEAQSDTDLEKYVRGTVSTVYHPIGTAAMLPRDAGGVVDATLRVYGTANLRVIDASIIPIHLSAHIQATVYAIAEKAVDIIKQGY